MNAYVLPPSSVQRVDVKDTIQLQEAYPDSNSSGVRAQQQKQAAGSAGDCVKGDRSNLINKSIQQQESATARPSPGDETTLAARAGPLPNAWHMLCNKKVWSNPDGRQHSDLPQQPLASNDEQQSMSSISSSSDVQRFSDLESNSTVEEEEAPTLTINRNQQKRNSKRLSRSSDNQNKRATSFTCNRKGTVPVGKHDGFGHKQDRDRVIKTDEIALFMRCKTRYSRPDFKPIPPAPGSWDEVKPERVIDWGQTADECSSYLSKYEQTHDITQATWRNVPWLHELESSASSASSTRTTTSSPNSSDNNKLTHQEEKTARQTASHTTNKEDNASEKKTDKRIRPPPLPPTLNTSGNSSSKGLTKQTPTAAKTFDHGVDFDITQQLPRSATESLHNPSSHRSLENSLNPQNIWRQNQHHSFDTQSSTYRRLSTGTDYNQRMYTPWTAPLLSSTSKQNPKDWMGKSASTASASRQDWAFGFMSWPPTTTKQQRGAAATAGSDSRSGWNSADSNPMQQWEDRFASILKVVDDDSSMSSMPPTPTESDVWAPPSLRPYSARDLDKRRSSSIETSHHRRWTLGGGSSNGGSYERDNVNNFVMASTQLLQNIVQNGSIGCRHCGSGTHSIARDCPFIASATPRDAWIQLIHAANSENIPFFFEALDTYSKCCPSETLQSIARNLLDVGCNLHLVAMDIPLTSTTMLVDLQGTSQRRYTVYAATCQVHCSGAAADAWQRAAACYPYGRKPGLPRSFEQNLQWLADAGFPRDLTDMGQCKACKQNGHWAKDCTALAQPQPPISSSSSSCLWQYPWLGGGGSASSRQLDGSSLDYSRNKFPPAGVANLTIAKRRSLTQSNSKEAVHRLYYSLNDYVLVDGI